jgi:hypothetical protein
MKIRLGFVSNSSSSSFVLIVDKELHDKVRETLPPIVQEVVDFAMEEKVVFGRRMMVYHDLNTMGGYSYVWEDCPIDWPEEEEWPEVPSRWREGEMYALESPHEAFYEYQQAIGNAPDKVFSSGQG